MKIRIGYVSNSSSSSFIIVSKKGELTKEKLLEMFKVPKESLLYQVAVEFADILIQNSNKASLKEILDDYGVEDIEDLPKYQQEALKIKGSTYIGSVSNEEEGLEPGLVDLDINFEDENITVKKEGGY